MRTRATSRQGSALATAMRLLVRREYFCAELRSRLLERGWPEEEVDLALNQLQEKGLLSDERAQQAWTEHYSGKRAVSADRLAAILAAKGGDTVPRPDPSNDLARARAAMEAKFKSFPDPARVARFLASRGFDEDVIASVLEGLEPQ